MATEVNQALAAHAQALLDQAAGRGQQAIDQVEADLEQFARLLVHQVRCARPWPTRAAARAEAGPAHRPRQGRLDEASVELLATVATRQRVRLRDFPGLLAASPPWPPSPPPTRPASDQLESELFGVATLVEREHGCARP